jgi:hypothetical protein
VLARRGALLSSTAIVLWQKAVWGSALGAAAMILLGAALLTVQKLRPGSPYDFSPAYQVVSMKFVP